jgi:hypothetical protein
MSTYTDARTTPGLVSGGTDERAMFARNFADDAMEAWEQTYDFAGQVMEKFIESGKSDVFPIIGRKRDATEHVPGEIILGGGIQHGEIEVTLDNMVIESAFIADIDEMMVKYNLSKPYSQQIGESLAGVSNARIGQMMVIASRNTTVAAPGIPIGSFYTDAAIATDASKIEAGFFAGVQYIKENDIGGGRMVGWLPWAQYLLLSRYSGIDSGGGGTSGSGDRSQASVGLVAGIQPRGTNSVPRTNITTTILGPNPTKYQVNATSTYGLIANPMAVAALRRKTKKITVTPQPDRLGTLIIGSQLEGYGQLRGECAFELSSSRT